MILLDVSSPDRIGVAGEALKTAKKTICLDHHISNHGFADENLIEPEMSSASELLFHLLEEEKSQKMWQKQFIPELQAIPVCLNIPVLHRKPCGLWQS